MKPYNCIVVLGPTASGKTRLACRLASLLEGEVVSADSRQVYRGLDIGTGKDYAEYTVDGVQIPYHLVDITDPGEQFYLQDFIREIGKAFAEITARGKIPIICGGTGLYLDALRKDFSLAEIPENRPLRTELSRSGKKELLATIDQYPEEFTARVDRTSVKRIIRGIEIAEFRKAHPYWQPAQQVLPFNPYYIGIKSNRDSRLELIAARLQKRLDAGLVAEVAGLIENGLSHARLEQLGLEYRFVSRFLRGMISESEMYASLLAAIMQFAKRQLTWFRKMEKDGVEIQWIDKEVNIHKLAKDIRPILAV